MKLKNEKVHVTHTIKPTYNKESMILILGSFPSVKSRENAYFYGHPQNRFWKVLANIYEDSLPETVKEKKEFLLKHHIAVYDVIQECDIIGSSDSSIENVIPSDILPLIRKSKIKTIYTNGSLASKLYIKYLYPITNMKNIPLPSTSPANASYSLEKLVEFWKIIKEKG